MYSGSTLTKTSGRILGAHQKFDKVARKHLAKIADEHAHFPTARKILHFEGKNGPDALKRKSPAKDEPWHYYSPFDDQDSILVKLIEDHYKQLVHELKQGNDERVAFEAAWLAHALVDGLTPAHHYPYEKKLVELRGGEGIETRTSIKAKWIIPGINRREKVKNNFKMWGPKGLITTHGLFELGIATIIAPLTFKEAVPSEHDIKRMMDIGVIAWFQAAAREIAVMDMYGAYYKRGWTPKLAWQVRHKLGPVITQTVTLTWYSALVEAGAIPRPKALQPA
ncbi:hypothetical protein KA047_00050 [Candidatus Saccharibacteria bacterium]|nr:hypothetical protein [Candidatus Saccharibacteria bacterium]